MAVRTAARCLYFALALGGVFTSLANAEKDSAWSWTSPASRPPAPPLPQPMCYVSKYVDNADNATAGIQAAVNACNPGGTVYFDKAGNFSTGAILLTGSVHVHIPVGVTLLAATERAAYPGPQNHWYLLHFRNCSGCSLSGGGTIDGQARRYITGHLPDRAVLRQFQDPSCFNLWECRPRMVGVVESTDVLLFGVRIVDPVYWTIHVIASQRVAIQEITIRGDWTVFNNDGIDVDSSSDVEIRECDIDTADDAICIKTTVPGTPVQRLRVTNCRLRSRACAVKIGSESVADMLNMTFDDLEIHGGTHRGLGIQLRDGGSITNVSFSRIMMDLHHEEFSWWGASEAIYVTAAPRFADSPVGLVRNISFTDIVATSENGIFISGGGIPGSVAEVVISRMELWLDNLSDWPGGYQDYRPGVLDVKRSGMTAALWVEQASDIALDDVMITYTKPTRPDWKQQVYTDHVAGMSMDNVLVRARLPWEEEESEEPIYSVATAASIAQQR